MNYNGASNCTQFSVVFYIASSKLHRISFHFCPTSVSAGAPTLKCNAYFCIAYITFTLWKKFIALIYFKLHYSFSKMENKVNDLECISEKSQCRNIGISKQRHLQYFAWNLPLPLTDSNVKLNALFSHFQQALVCSTSITF